MSFDSVDRSTDSGRPFELFQFIAGQRVYLYTNANEDKVYPGSGNEHGMYAEPGQDEVRFISTAIDLGEIEIATIGNGSRMVLINCPYDLDIVVAHAYGAYPEEIEVTVWRGHEGEPELKTIWIGLLSEFSVQGRQAQIASGSVLQTMLNRTVNRVKAQTLCNHTLYDLQCGVDPAPHTTVLTILNAVANRVRINGSLVVDDLKGGTAVLLRTGERRLITGNSSVQVILAVGFSDVLDGDQIQLQRGCDHVFSGDCLSKFNNQLRYGGFVYLPRRITDER